MNKKGRYSIDYLILIDELDCLDELDSDFVQIVQSVHLRIDVTEELASEGSQASDSWLLIPDLINYAFGSIQSLLALLLGGMIMGEFDNIVRIKYTREQITSR